MNKNTFKAKLAVLSVLSIFVAFSFGYAMFSNLSGVGVAEASGISLSVSPQAEDVSTATTMSVEFTASNTINSGDIVDVSYDSGYTGTLSLGNTTINGSAPSAITASTSGSTTTVKLTNPAAISAGSTVTIITSALTTPVAAGNYSWSILTTSGDFGAGFMYVGEYNIVDVRAYVPVALSFNIRNAADTANTNICDLGTQSTSVVTDCSYRLKVGTNAQNGYAITMVADGDLTNGTYNMNNAVCGPTGSPISAGSELYGIELEGGSITASGGSVTTNSDFDTAAGNVACYNQTTETNLLNADGPNAPAITGDTTNTTLVTHKLGVDTNTPAGYYTQRITYKVYPNF